MVDRNVIPLCFISTINLYRSLKFEFQIIPGTLFHLYQLRSRSHRTKRKLLNNVLSIMRSFERCLETQHEKRKLLILWLPPLHQNPKKS